MEMDLFYAGRYTRPEKVVQRLSCFMLCLIVRGIEYMDFYSRGKIRLTPPAAVRGNAPFLLLIHPGITLDFSAGKLRENWTAMLELPEVEYDGDSLRCSFRNIPLEPVVKLPVSRVCSLRETFAAAVENADSGHPGAREKAKLQLGSLLAELLAVPDPRTPRSPAAAAMKKAIDEDIRFRSSVRELNERLGFCSLPCMRKLFRREYGLLPGKYRSVRRLNRIMELFAQSDLSLKMIADEAGMKHLSHLYAFLRNEQDLSPGELLAQIRGRRGNFAGTGAKTDTFPGNGRKKT